MIKANFSRQRYWLAVPIFAVNCFNSKSLGVESVLSMCRQCQYLDVGRLPLPGDDGKLRKSRVMGVLSVVPPSSRVQVCRRFNDALSATALERAEAISRTMDNDSAAIAAMRLAENHG
jgi:hypothetical protein